MLVAALWRRIRAGRSVGRGASGRPGRRALRDEDALLGYGLVALVLAFAGGTGCDMVAPGEDYDYLVRGGTPDTGHPYVAMLIRGCSAEMIAEVGPNGNGRLTQTSPSATSIAGAGR